ncbi:hypothetical protein ACWEQA_01915 [Nocardia sp. NPDC004085]|uniref:hypothetical protein n=1 Tax=Nocardia sp. NPDC019255 TaxID=3154591 RepID=UPI0034066C8D
MSRPARATPAGDRFAPIRELRHIRVDTGAFAVEYQAGAAQIADVVAEPGAHAGFVVTVADDIRPGLPPLPCGELWN